MQAQNRPRRLLARALLALFLALSMLLSMGELGPLRAASLKQLRIILSEESEPELVEFLRDKFPEAEIVSQDVDVAIDSQQRPALILMPEHQAYPLLEQGIGRGFMPLYRASLIFGRRTGQMPSRWQDLSSELNAVVSTTPQRYLVAALRDRLAKSEANATLSTLGELYSQGRYKILKSPELKVYQALRTVLEEGERPDLLLAWDHQIVALNRQIEAIGGSDRYLLTIPLEGSLFVDFGLFATDRNAYNLLQQRLGLKSEGENLKELLNLGFRSPEGTVKEGLGFPSAEDYYAVSRIKNYYTFNERETSDIADFKHRILGISRLTPVTQEGEFFSYLLMTIALMTWLGFLFYRLDEPKIRLPLRLYIGTLVIWLLLRMAELLLPHALEKNSWYTFWPMLLLAAAWIFLAWRQIQRRRLNTASRQRLFYAALALLLLAVVALASNPYHRLILQTENQAVEGNIHALNQIQAGPGLYLIAVLIFFIFCLGYAFLYQAREQKLKLALALLPLGLITLNFIYNLLYLSRSLNIESGALIRNNAFMAALLLELLLQLKFLPINTKYFRFFRYNPLNMRLISSDLEDIYASESLPELNRADKLRLRRIIRSEFQTPAKSALRFGLKREKEAELPHGLAKVELEGTDGLLALKQISGGYLLWVEDVTDLHHLRARLTELSQRLEEQQNILRQRQSIRAQLASQKIRRTLFSDLEAQLSFKMGEISELIQELKQEEAGGREEEIKRRLARLRMMVSQAKRKSNLLVRQEPAIEPEEMRLIFSEALQDAESAGITGLVIVQGERSIETSRAILCYDYVQEILQNNAELGRLSIFLRMDIGESQIQLRLIMSSDHRLGPANYRLKPELSERLQALGAHVEVSSEDNDLNLQLIMEEPDA